MRRLGGIGSLALTASLFFVAAPKAHGDPVSFSILWQLDGVTFENNATAAGWLVVNYSTPALYCNGPGVDCSQGPFAPTLEGFGLSISPNHVFPFNEGPPIQFTTGPSSDEISNCTFDLSACLLSYSDGFGNIAQFELSSSLLQGVNFPFNRNIVFSSGYYQAEGNEVSNLVSGGLVGTGVPEPASVVLMLTGGLTLLGLAWRKRGFITQL